MARYIDKHGNYLKLIPRRYKDLKNIERHFLDTTKKRLNKKERLSIEKQIFIDNLQNDSVKSLIKGKEITLTEKVHVRNDDNYFTATFGNIKVKCQKGLYDAFETKNESFVTL